MTYLRNLLFAIIVMSCLTSCSTSRHVDEIEYSSSYDKLSLLQSNIVDTVSFAVIRATLRSSTTDTVLIRDTIRLQKIQSLRYIVTQTDTISIHDTVYQTVSLHNAVNSKFNGATSNYIVPFVLLSLLSVFLLLIVLYKFRN